MIHTTSGAAVVLIVIGRILRGFPNRISESHCRAVGFVRTARLFVLSWGCRKDDVGSRDKIEKLVERAEHEGTPPAEAAACREKVKAIRQKPRTLVVQPPTPEDLEEADLGELAVIANKFHEQAEAGIANTLNAAWSAGQTLLTAKERCEHGEWGHWVEANFHGTKRTAQRYMRLASKRHACRIWTRRCRSTRRWKRSRRGPRHPRTSQKARVSRQQRRRARSS